MAVRINGKVVSEPGPLVPEYLDQGADMTDQPDWGAREEFHLPSERITDTCQWSGLIGDGLPHDRVFAARCECGNVAAECMVGYDE